MPVNTLRKAPFIFYLLIPKSYLWNMSTTIPQDISGLGNDRDFPTISSHRHIFLLFHLHGKPSENKHVAEMRVFLSGLLSLSRSAEHKALGLISRGPVQCVCLSLFLPLAPISRAAPEAPARLKQPVPRVSTQRCVNTPGLTSTQECFI